MSTTPGTNEFELQLATALREPSDEAARIMLARGRSVTYRERDTPPGHVIREHPDGTKETIKINLAAETSAA